MAPADKKSTEKKPAAVKAEKADAPAIKVKAEPKAEKADKPKKVKAAAPVVEEAAAEPANDEAMDVDESDPVAMLTLQRDAIIAAYNAQISSIQAEKKNFMNYHKLAAKAVKAAQRSGKKNKQRKTGGAPRAPAGFTLPGLISDELSAFLKKEKGTMISRTDVTREINAYIKENNLQNPASRRFILADKKLSKLLNIDKSTPLSYFNLQKYLSPHFMKIPKETAAAATAQA